MPLPGSRWEVLGTSQCPFLTCQLPPALAPGRGIFMLPGASPLHPRSPPDSQTRFIPSRRSLLSPGAFSWSSARLRGLSDTHLPGSTSPLL